jgi:hypothetical protein
MIPFSGSGLFLIGSAYPPSLFAQPVEYFSHPDEKVESFSVVVRLARNFDGYVLQPGRTSGRPGTKMCCRAEDHCKPQKSIKMSSSKVIIGFLAGAIVGGVLGVLLAPDKGSETRRKIIEKGNDLGDSISEFGGTIKDKVSQMVNGARGGVDA